MAERGSDIGVLVWAAFQLGLESAGVVAYLFGLFLYAIAAAVVLPIPVELLLLLYPELNPAFKAIALGLGKAVGAIVVFFVGNKVNPYIERWMDRHPIGKRVLKFLEGFVRRTGWPGLMILLAIPFMSDTAVNYFYSLLNEEGHAIGRWQFVLANLIGGIVRAYLFLWLLPR
ncbi:MAG: VTT domain-containing protein [Methanobacteriota archaeon]|nr:MAG: VTT domain-containing protein [Euryarchaeota archaeon]